MTHHSLECAVAAHQLLGKSHTLGVNEVRGPFGIHGRCAHLRRRAHYNYQGTDGHSHRHCARNLQKSPLHGFTLRRNGTAGLHRSNYLSVSLVDGKRSKCCSRTRTALFYACIQHQAACCPCKISPVCAWYRMQRTCCSFIHDAGCCF